MSIRLDQFREVCFTLPNTSARGNCMNRQEAIDHFNRNGRCLIIVAHKRSGVRYTVARDIVECGEGGNVYGEYTDKVTGPFGRRRGASYRWFNLKSVDFVEAVAL